MACVPHHPTGAASKMILVCCLNSETLQLCQHGEHLISTPLKPLGLSGSQVIRRPWRLHKQVNKSGVDSLAVPCIWSVPVLVVMGVVSLGTQRATHAV